MTNLTDQTFLTAIEESPTPVLVEFWATWCGPCRLMTPILEELEKTWEGKITIVKLDVDDNPATAKRYGVMSIPTLMLFKGGRSIDRIVGMSPKADILKRVKNALMD